MSTSSDYVNSFRAQYFPLKFLNTHTKERINNAPIFNPFGINIEYPTPPVNTSQIEGYDNKLNKFNEWVKLYYYRLKKNNSIYFIILFIVLLLILLIN